MCTSGTGSPNLNNCISKNSRFIIIPLGIELREGSHANYIIYDKGGTEIESDKRIYYNIVSSASEIGW